jgi:outer membrane protein assembly factor BamE
MRKALSHAVLALLVAGCSYMPSIPFVGPHKIDIQQGNYVTQAMVDRLKPGMTRSQVRFALGTPLIADPFHPDRWDYVYVYEHKGRVFAKRRIVVVFKDDALVRVEGDVVPRAAKEGDAPASKPSTPTAATGGSAR